MFLQWRVKLREQVATFDDILDCIRISYVNIITAFRSLTAMVPFNIQLFNSANDAGLSALIVMWAM